MDNSAEALVRANVAAEAAERGAGWAGFTRERLPPARGSDVTPRPPILRARFDGLVVDSFAGGGGASLGIELALGRSVDLAINHDPEAIARFCARVDTDGPVPASRPELGPCWIWTGSRLSRSGSPSCGVASLGRRGHRMLAHRFAWEITRGAIPDGLVVCHACDNPPCVRPSHLFLGTQAENLKDMRAKGRGHRNPFRSGTAHHGAKLDAERVRAIRTRRAEGLSFAKLGAEFGLHPSTVHDIVHRKTWREVA